MPTLSLAGASKIILIVLKSRGHDDANFVIGWGIRTDIDSCELWGSWRCQLCRKSLWCQLCWKSLWCQLFLSLAVPEVGCHEDNLWCYQRRQQVGIMITCVFQSRGGYSSSSRAGRLGRTLWPQNSTSVAETEKGGQNCTMTPPTLEKGGSIFYISMKSLQKKGVKNLQL